MVEAMLCNIQGVDDEVGFVMLSFKESVGARRKKINKELFKKV
jgi:hypothetical protein